MSRDSARELGDLPSWALALVQHARVARLGLIDDAGGPRVLPVTFVLHGGAFFSAVDEKRKRVPARRLARVRFLRERQRAALTVDRYEDDWGDLAWVQALGRAQLLEPAEHPAALDALCAKYEQYRLRPPGGPLIRLAPERFLWWRASGQ